MNSRSKVNSLIPLPIVPIILLKLLLVPATIDPKNGSTPPLFLPASNSLANWAGFPRIFNPDATPTKDYIVYILLIPLICFCFSGVEISIGERWICASSTSTKLKPILDRSCILLSYISDIFFLKQSLISTPFIPKELRWNVCYYCEDTYSLIDFCWMGRYFYIDWTCFIKETIN